MSRSRSVSLEIVPPNTSRSLAAILDAAFKINSRQNGGDGKGSEDAEADPEEPPAPQTQSNATSAAAVGFPPTPCERCVRTKKTCKGVAGARCEYCKRLKQKCSNSTGPARGKHAVPKQPKPAVASTSKPVPAIGSAGGSDATMWQDRPKRKAPEKLSTSQNGNTDDGEGSDDEEDGQQNAIKKPRLSRPISGSGPSRSLLVKAVAEMEASVKRVQTSVAKEVEKMNGIVKTLNAKIKEMDED